MAQSGSKKALSLDEVLAAQHKDATATPKRTKTKKEIELNNPENRTVLVWLKLPHSLGYCTNPECPDTRPRKVAEGNAMCSNVNGVIMCRLCFLDGYGMTEG